MRRLSAGLAASIGLAVFLAGCAPKPTTASQGPDGTQTAKVIVKEGYSPSHIVAKAGQPLKVEFYRDEAHSDSCDSDLVVPSENIKLHLPVREGQIVEIKAQPPGEVAFQCGMGMMKGKIEFN